MAEFEDFGSPAPATATLVSSPIVQNIPTNPPMANRRPTILSLFIALLAGDFIYRMVVAILTITIITTSLNKSHGVFPVFSVVPVFCVLPVVFAVIAIFLIYIFLKTRDLSSTSYKLLLATSVAVPLFYSLLIYLMLSQSRFISLVTGSSNSNLSVSIFSAVLNEVTFSFLITWLIIKKNKGLFVNPPSILSAKQKIILTILGLLILFPAVSVTYTVIKYSFYPDTKHAQTQTEVGHKVYSPKYLPQKLEVTSQYYIDEKNALKLPNPTVKTAFDISAKKIRDGSKSKTVVLSQSLVPSGFQLPDYLSKQFPGVIPEEIELSTAGNKIGYSIIPTPKTENGAVIKSLYFITPDNILINLAAISPQINARDLVDITESLN